MSISQTQSSINVAHLNVVRTLGEGSFGEVKLLVDRNDSNVMVAVKVIDLTKYKNQKDNVRREALLQKYLRGHINVLGFINSRVTADNYFQLFLEYADGGELFDRIDPDHGMHSEKAKFFFAQLANGLEFVHNQGIVHRDIKPENLLLTKRDILKISDFGMATIYRHQDRERMLDTRCGTWPYVAPEVLVEKYRGPPIDVWSAGIVLVAMLVGELPWEHPSPSDANYREWISGEAYNKPPWNRIATLQLALLKGVLDPNPTTRFSIDRIMNHPWFCEETSLAHDGPSNKRLKTSNPAGYFMMFGLGQNGEQALNYSQPTELTSMRAVYYKSALKDGVVDQPTIEFGEPGVTSFTQPDNIESLLLTKSQAGPSQSNHIHPLQTLAKRMTRFCVKISVEDLLQMLTKACGSRKFLVKMRMPQQMLVTSEKLSLSFIVTVYEMIEDGQLKVLADFRRSKGDGIEFMRVFLAVKSELDPFICNQSYDWLLHHGLFCSEQLSALRIASSQRQSPSAGRCHRSKVVQWDAECEADKENNVDSAKMMKVDDMM